ncbi:MAG TPA: hypothetical protein PL126_02765 [Candidatus Cloacimonadota bacterium]|nr:hypothetical protein [Candidatus Cloacimonadota bacterium]
MITLRLVALGFLFLNGMLLFRCYECYSSEQERQLKMTDREAIWDAKDSSGYDCPSGVYLLG